MIIIERTWTEPLSGGGTIGKIARQAFDENDHDGVTKFINKKNTVSGYEWTNIKYKYIKL